jgi:hypothetical protein
MTQGPPTEEDWPATIEEAVDRLLPSISDEDKAIVRDTAEEDLIRFHHGWGTGIRNAFGLWRGNRALLASTGASHPDDASMKIICAVWARLQAGREAPANPPPR